MRKLAKDDLGLVLKGAIATSVVISFFIVLLSSPFDRGSLDHVIKAVELSLWQTILVNSYSVFFLIPGVFLFMLVVFILVQMANLSLRNIIFKILLPRMSLGAMIFLFLVAGISSAGFIYEYIEDREHQVNFKEIFSDTQKDMNIILIVIDALRADHLGCYGYQRNTSPVIDAFAKEGTLFKNCYSQAPFTTPSVGTLMTSLYPRMHGAIQHAWALSSKTDTLAEILKREGYLTYGYVTNPNLKKMFNYDQGFDFYDDQLIQDKLYLAALRKLPVLNKFISFIAGKKFDSTDKDNINLAMPRIMKWLKHYKSEKFFMYLHFMEPHEPYNPPRPFREMFKSKGNGKATKDLALYDGEIRFADEYIGVLLEQLKSYGIYDKTLIIITSDHGEAFGEHNDFGHGHTVYQELVHVPLIMRYKGMFASGGTVNQAVRLLDVMPTILDVLKIDFDKAEGVSLLEYTKALTQRPPPSDVFLERTFYIKKREQKHILLGIIRDNRWKYVYSKDLQGRSVLHQEMYDLKADPKEMNDLSSQRPQLFENLRATLEDHDDYCLRHSAVEEPREIDLGTIDQLKSLGYLN